jgi:hypothetical protein
MLIERATNDPTPQPERDQKSFLSIRNLLTHGGSMQRLLIAFMFSLVFLGILQDSKAQRIIDVSGYLQAGQTRTFYSRTPANSNTDTIYRISGNYSITGKLIIQEGAEVHFLPGSRIIDTVGGKIIANGFSGLQRRIQFRGINVNNASYEWGHILVLPQEGVN